MRYLLGVLLFGLYAGVTAQRFSTEVWHNGFLVTQDQDTIQGAVKYNMETNIVLVSRNNVVQSFSSHKIFYFQIFDEVLDTYRQFYSLPYEVTPDYEAPILFEVLYEGPLSLISRESVVTETVNSATSYYGGTYLQDVLRHEFFFVDKEGKITFFSGRKQDLYAIMTKKHGKIRDFVKKNRLDTGEIKDLVRITAFYNSI